MKEPEKLEKYTSIFLLSNPNGPVLVRLFLFFFPSPKWICLTKNSF